MAANWLIGRERAFGHRCFVHYRLRRKRRNIFWISPSWHGNLTEPSNAEALDRWFCQMIGTNQKITSLIATLSQAPAT